MKSRVFVIVVALNGGLDGRNVSRSYATVELHKHKTSVLLSKIEDESDFKHKSDRMVTQNEASRSPLLIQSEGILRDAKYATKKEVLNTHRATNDTTEDILFGHDSIEVKWHPWTTTCMHNMENVLDRLSSNAFFNKAGRRDSYQSDKIHNSSIGSNEGKQNIENLALPLHIDSNCTISKKNNKWILEMEKEVSAVYAAEAKAENLVNIAFVEVAKARNLSAHVVETSKKTLRSKFEAYTSEALKLQQELQSVTHINSSVPLARKSTWEDAGYSFVGTVTPDAALDAILAFPLKSYKLLKDSKAEIHVSSKESLDERRTRSHVGIIDTDVIAEYFPAQDGNFTTVDPSFFFSYNIRALSQLANIVDEITIKMRTLRIQDQSGNSIQKRIDTLHLLTDNRANKDFKSVSQLASEAAALESEASSTNVVLLSRKVKHALRMQQMQAKIESRLDFLSEQDHVFSRIDGTESEKQLTTDLATTGADAELDELVNHMGNLGLLLSKKNETRRELLRLREAQLTDIKMSKEAILREADYERATESRTLKQIKELGEEATRELIDMLHLAFENIANSMNYVFNTKQGKKDFLFFVLASSMLFFSILAVREIIVLVFFILQNYLTTPKLVKEYGGSNVYWTKKNSEKQFEQYVVLPQDINVRLKSICRSTSRAYQRGVPLRNILLYGPPGTGKTSAAKCIGSIIDGIPYALVSGADIAPLGMNGPTEIKKLFAWANKQRRGAILILDEAESALKTRNCGTSNSPVMHGCKGGIRNSRDILNVFLSLTGTMNSNVMLVLTSSQPHLLDEAVLDRMDEIIKISRPGKDERRKMLLKGFSERFTKRKSSFYERAKEMVRQRHLCYHLSVEEKFNISRAVHNISETMTEGCSGRELRTILQGIACAVYSTEKCTLSNEIWNIESSKLCQQMKIKWKLTDRNGLSQMTRLS